MIDQELWSKAVENKDLNRQKLAKVLGIPETMARNIKFMLTHGTNPDLEQINKTKEEQIVTYLTKVNRPVSYEELAKLCGVSVKSVREYVQHLNEKHINLIINDEYVEKPSTIVREPASKIDISKFADQTIKFGLTSDNHLCSKYSRLDVVNALYDIWESQGIDTVYQCGNIIDGDARFNQFDVLVRGVENQAKYLIENYPTRKGMTTKFITCDDHEGWYVQREGINIGKYLMATAREYGREDLVYLGHMEHDVHFAAPEGEAVMRIIHGGGGSSYATSYKTQKIVESYQGGEKPNILLVGHYHKANFDYSREVNTVQAGTTCDQTPFMRKNNLQAHVGGWIISFTLDKHGVVHNFTQQWHPFFDRNYYEKKWNYKF